VKLGRRRIGSKFDIFQGSVGCRAVGHVSAESVEVSTASVMLPPTAPNDRRFWFPAKRYGWGWGLPSAWQGWVVLAVWIAVVAVGASFLAGRHWVGYAGFMITMSVVLIGVCYAKGEPPRGRWGG